MKNLLLIILAFYANIVFAQKQNNNWINGNRLWDFNNSTNGNFADSFISTGNTFRQSVSNVSDRNTGNLLFYTNGITIYNKNSLLMEDGSDLFGPNTTISMTEGNNSSQGSLIIPDPGDANKYYVFSLNNGYGLRYAVVDMSYNTGLGKVISKNNILLSNNTTDVMTSCVSNDGGHWLVTQNNAGNYLSYKITTSGISSPVVSTQTYNLAKEGLKISPNKQYLFEIGKKDLFYFDNSNGNISLFQSSLAAMNGLYNPCSVEFSEDSNVIYFLIIEPTYSIANPYATILRKHIISSGLGYYAYNVPGHSFAITPGSLQRHSNGNIYIKQYSRTSSIGSYSLYKITNTNSTALDFNNVQYSYYDNSSYGYTFPQLVEYPPTCVNTLAINQNITNNGNYKASNQITASSIINPNLIVNYAAGNQISLLHGFQVSGNSTGVFRAYLEECNPNNIVARINNNYAPNSLENSINNLKIYPNPVSNILTIDNGKEKLVSWQLYDNAGKLIRNGNSNTINVQSIPNASYVLKINLDKTQISKTIIVKH